MWLSGSVADMSNLHHIGTLRVMSIMKTLFVLAISKMMDERKADANVSATRQRVSRYSAV